MNKLKMYLEFTTQITYIYMNAAQSANSKYTTFEPYPPQCFIWSERQNYENTR